MIVQLAIATHIPVREWWGESDAVIATAFVILEEANQKGPK